MSGVDLSRIFNFWILAISLSLFYDVDDMDWTKNINDVALDPFFRKICGSCRFLIHVC
jgi:hypothetical protein